MADDLAARGNGSQDQVGQHVGRRDFLRKAGAAAAAVAFVGIGLPVIARGPAFPRMAESSGVIMPDPTLCIGCLSCEVACSDVHRAVGMSEVPRIRIYGLDWIELDEQILENYGNRGHYIQQVCVQCPDAPCLPVCPVDAFQVEPITGARIIQEDVCIECGKCDQACIFPALDEAFATGSDRNGQRSRITHDEAHGTFAKCDLCYFREEGAACIQRCPVNIRINQGIIQSDVMCLDLAPADRPNFIFLDSQQHVSPDAPAPGQLVKPEPVRRPS